MKNIASFFSLISLSGASFVLVDFDKRTNGAVANEAPKLEPRHKGWKSRFWHDYDDEKEGRTRTVTITITVTVTQTAGLFPTGEEPFANVSTTSVDDSTLTSIVDSPAPISLTDIDTSLPTSSIGSDDSAPASTDVADVAPVPNDIPPITLIDLESLQARAAKET